MTHPIPTETFKKKLEDLIKVNSKISTNSKRKVELLAKLVDESKIISDKKSIPGKPKLTKIKATTEVAFQRAIYNGISSKLNENTEVNWIDIEIPVVLGEKGRRHCIDMIGTTSDKNNLVLCELKYSGKTKSEDSPTYAIFELLIYYYFLRCNFKNLDSHNVYHKLETTKNFSWEGYLSSDIPKLVIAANNSYWEFWFGKKRINKSDLLKDVIEFEKEFGVKIELFETSNDEFRNQKGDSIDYEPKVISNVWTKICN
jgi:hypothetical protein